jgi:hypothetical protein
MTADAADPVPANSNQHPAEYAELLELIVSGTATPVGAEWFAVVSAAGIRRIDIATAEPRLDPDVFNALVHTTRQTRRKPAAPGDDAAGSTERVH